MVDFKKIREELTDPGLTVWTYGPDKFRNKTIGELPSSFLKWAAENCSNDRLAVAADKEWSYREKYNLHFYDEG